MIRANYYDSSERLPESPPGLIELWGMLRRQWFLVATFSMLGIALAGSYCVLATRIYQSDATVYIRPKNGQAAQIGGESLIEPVMLEDELATHLEILQSEHVIAQALRDSGMDQAESVLGALDDDETPVEYVHDNLVVAKGGDGGSRLARVLKVSLRHTSAEDCQTILDAIIKKYEAFLEDDKKSEMQDALAHWEEKRDKMQAEFELAEQQYHDFYEQAPLLLRHSTSADSANTHLEEASSLDAKLTEIRVQWADVRAKLAAMRVDDLGPHASTEQYLERFGLIDQNAMKQLELILAVHSDSTSNPRQGVANAKAELLRYRLQEQELKIRFGSDHPEVKQTAKAIKHIEQMIAQKEQGSAAALDPRLVVRAYIGSLRGKSAALKAQAQDLRKLRDRARSEAKKVVHFQTEHDRLVAQMQRHRELVNAADDQIEETRTARDYNGFITKIIKAVELGERVSPRPALFLLVGAFLGIGLGACIGVIRDYSRRETTLSAQVELPKHYENRLDPHLDSISG